MKCVERQLGKYRLKQLLGTGEFADVYFGEHLYLKNPVAIKVLHSRLNPSTLEDFLTEARYVSHLVHPHIIRVFDFGLDRDIPFLVMDYASNGNLRQRHPVGMKVPLPLVVSYTMALASALQHAHNQHLVHRDIKPENVLLGPNYEVLLCDFGLALHTSYRESSQVRERFGNLSYMAPELIHGQTAPASDQYALALMVYEWLCGHHPFSSVADQMYDEPLYRDTLSLCEVHPDAPRAVEQVVLKGLSREPSGRFVNVISFAIALKEASQTGSSQYAMTTLPEIRDAGARSTQYYHAPRFHHISKPLTPLIGREKELQATCDLLLRQEVRLVTLTGPGGIGKTHLALALGNELFENFAGDVCFVPLSTVSDSEHVISAIMQRLGLPELRNTYPINLLKTTLSNRRILLILDSFEHVLPAALQIADLLSSCSELKILVTSRALLHVGGEYIYAVKPLEVPVIQRRFEPESLSLVPSVALFVQRAQVIQPGFRLTVENGADIATICTRLEGVPLAIELAAEQCNLFSLRILLAWLERPLEVLVGRRRDVPERHLSLLSTLSWDDDLLTPDEQTLFRGFAVFVGGCSLQAIEAISKALGGLTISVLDGVRSLIDKSLLRFATFGEDEIRLSLLELVRAYALKGLTECGDLIQVRDAHAAYYQEQAEKALRSIDTQHARWREILEREAGNMQAAMEWLLERKKSEHALQLGTALATFWSLSGSFGDGYRFLQNVMVDFEQCRGTDSQTIQTTEQLLHPPYGELTARELDVLRLLATGLSNKQIAERLVLSQHTVSVHIHSIFSKLDVHSRSAATRYALDHQLA